MAGMVRRFRLRFTVRTVAILVTLICVYFGAWEATKRHANTLQPPTGRANFFTLDGERIVYEGPYWDGSRNVDIQWWKFASSYDSDQLIAVWAVDSPGPLVIAQHEQNIVRRPKSWDRRRQYYIWMFGPTWKLPFWSVPG